MQRPLSIAVPPDGKEKVRHSDARLMTVLDALAVNLDGSPAAPEYFSRRRRVLRQALGYAVRKKRLVKNPLSKGNLPEEWTPPEAPDMTLDPRVVGSPALVAGTLAACSYIGSRQGTHFVAFYACMYYAMMRPSEVAALLRARIEQFGTGPDGRLFRSENSNPIQPSTWWQVWQKSARSR